MRGQRLPIDIERSGPRGFRPPFQDVEPPGIVGVMNAHVVGHEVENEADIRPPECCAKATKRIRAAEFGIKRIVVYYIIAVRTARPCFEKWRSIKVTDAEFLEIGRQRGRLVEPELRRKLETVSGERDGGRHHSAPMLQNTDHGGSAAGSSPPQIDRSGGRAGGGWASASDKWESSLSVCPSASDQSDVTIGPSQRATANFVPASRGRISRRRVARRSRISASRLRPLRVADACQSSTAERNVASSSGSGIAPPNSA